MTINKRRLIEAVLQAKESGDYDARHWGVELFGHTHRTALSLQSRPMPLVCVESLGAYNYRPYAFYVHNPLICGCRESILKLPYLIDFCKDCKGVVKPDKWYRDIISR